MGSVGPAVLLLCVVFGPVLYWSFAKPGSRPKAVQAYFDLIDRVFAPRPPTLDNGPLLRRMTITAILFETVLGLGLYLASRVLPSN